MNSMLIAERKMMRRGAQAGLISLILFLPALFQSLLSGADRANIALVVAGMILSLVGGVSYIIFLMGLKEVGRELNSARLVNDLQAGILVTAFMLPINLFAPLVVHYSKVADVLYLIVGFGVMIPFGIISIRLARDFSLLENELGIVSRKVARWQKISGYMMVTVVLGVIGSLLSVITDYYMWRLLKQRLSMVPEPTAGAPDTPDEPIAEQPEQ